MKNWKKLTALLLALALVCALCACGAKKDEAAAEEPAAAEQPAEETAEETTDAPEEETEPPAEEPEEPETPAEQATLRITAMKGPTSMGLAKLLTDNDADACENHYEFTMVTGADEVTAALVGEQTDIAMLPANAAAALYNKAGGFTTVAINTLGVLYVVENGEEIQSIDDLAGRTVYMTGKGTTPEYALRYVLRAHEIEDSVTLEFKSEPAEVVAALADDVAAVALLPQPFVTAAIAQNEGLRTALSLSEEWDAVSDGSRLVTGVTVVRNAVLEENPNAVKAFLAEYGASVAYVNENPEEMAAWIAEQGIVGAAPIAQKAIPQCNLVCITGAEMETALSGYLQTLYDANPDAVGGVMPDGAFYGVDAA